MSSFRENLCGILTGSLIMNDLQLKTSTFLSKNDFSSNDNYLEGLKIKFYLSHKINVKS